MQSHPTSSRFSRLSPLLWAVFLGCSWTWVIGMFLPVLLVRDFGAWAWVVFAVPNVVGAAAMGWVLRDAPASERFVARHAKACYAFSVVTVAFHVFFAMWMIQRVRGLGPLTLLAAAVMLAVGVGNHVLWHSLVPRWKRGRRGPEAAPRGFDVVLEPSPDPLPVLEPLGHRAAPAGRLAGSRGVRWLGALGVMALSVAMWNMLYGQDALALPPAAPLGGGDAGFGLAYLAPVFLLGFALNPYLDLTFHRARQGTSPAGGRFAFGVGFGVVFLSMIVFTLLYARLLLPAVRGEPLSMVMSIYLSFHLVAQSAFTIAAHVGELPLGRRADGGAGGAAGGFARAVGLLVVLAVAAAVGWYASTPQRVRGHDLGEVAYWCFLGFYGLVFPGYVWLCALPGKAAAPPGRRARALAVLAATVVIAFPMYWMGFVEGRHAWLVPGLLVLLLSRLFVPRAATGATEAGADAESFNSGPMGEERNREGAKARR